MAATFIINGGTGFSTTGSWNSGLVGAGYGYGNTMLYCSSSSGNTASWNFTGLTASTAYWIAMDSQITGLWAPSSWCATSTWQILDSNGSTVLSSGTLNQQIVPQGMVYTNSNAETFMLVGSVTPSGTSCTLKITSGASGYVGINAALIQPATDPRGCGAISAGNWNGSIWAANAQPTTNDYVFIGAAVTLNQNASIGKTAFVTGGQPALTFNAGGSLTLNFGYQLTLSGDIAHLAASTVTMNNGSTISFRPPSGQTCVWNFGASNAINTLVANGTSGYHCVVKTDLSLGGNNSYMTAGSYSTFGVATATYTDFSNFGTSTQNGIQSLDDGSLNPNFSITNCTFTGCSYSFGTGSDGSWDGNFTFSNNIFSSSIGYTGQGLTQCAQFAANNNYTSGTRTISTNSFDLEIYFGAYRGYTFTGNFCGAGWFINGFPQWPAASNFAGNLLVTAADGGGPTGVGGSINGNYFAYSTTDNPHFLSFPDASITVNGCIFESCGGGTPGGKAFLTGDPSAPRTYTIQNCLTLPVDPGGNNMGVQLLNVFGAGTDPNHYVTVDVLHCTVCCGQNFAAHYSENGATGTGQIGLYKANLFWAQNMTSSNAYKLWDAGSPTSGGTSNVVSPTNADYNGGYQMQAGPYTGNTYTYAGNGYQGNYTATPGAHDINNTNPQFVDSTRCLATWGGTATGGGTATVAAALATLAANPALISQATTGLIPWVLAGFRPTNQTYHSASYPTDPSTQDAAGNSWTGTYPDVGAMAYQQTTFTFSAPGLAITGSQGADTAGPLPAAAGIAINGAFGASRGGFWPSLPGIAITGNDGAASWPINWGAAPLNITGTFGPSQGGFWPSFAGLAISGATGGANWPIYQTAAALEIFGNFGPPPVVYLVDTFQGAAGTSLGAHASDSGAAWDLLAGNTSVSLGGSGMVYLSGTQPSIWISTAAMPSSDNFEARYTFERLSSVMGTDTGVTLLMANPWTGARITFNWIESSSYFTFENAGTYVGPTASGPALNVPWFIKIDVSTSGGNTTFAASYATSYGGAWTALCSYTVATPASPPNVGLYFVGTSATVSTGAHIGNLHVTDIPPANIVSIIAPESGLTIGGFVGAASWPSYFSAAGLPITHNLGPFNVALGGSFTFSAAGLIISGYPGAANQTFAWGASGLLISGVEGAASEAASYPAAGQSISGALGGLGLAEFVSAAGLQISGAFGPFNLSLGGSYTFYAGGLVISGYPATAGELVACGAAGIAITDTPAAASGGPGPFVPGLQISGLFGPDTVVVETLNSGLAITGAPGTTTGGPGPYCAGLLITANWGQFANQVGGLYAFSAAGLQISGFYGPMTSAEVGIAASGLDISGFYGPAAGTPSFPCPGLAISAFYAPATNATVLAAAPGLQITDAWGATGETAGIGLAGLQISDLPGGLGLSYAYTISLPGLLISAYPGPTTGGAAIPALWLPYEFATTLMPSALDTTDAWGIDPEQTAPLSAALDTGGDPFGIDPEQSTPIMTGLDGGP